MKRSLFAVIGIIVLLVIYSLYTFTRYIPADEYPDNPIIHPEWKECDIDSDCAETQYQCCACENGGVQSAINERYLDSWHKWLDKACKDIGCLTYENCKQGSAQCCDGRCEFYADSCGQCGVFCR